MPEGEREFRSWKKHLSDYAKKLQLPFILSWFWYGR